MISQVSEHKSKPVYDVNQNSTMFQRQTSRQNDVDSTLILCWPTSQRYFNIYQLWINVECFIGNTSLELFQHFQYIQKSSCFYFQSLKKFLNCLELSWVLNLFNLEGHISYDIRLFMVYNVNAAKNNTFINQHYLRSFHLFLFCGLRRNSYPLAS